MASRIELQALLETLLGNRNVYYQPPESIKIKYPAIVYSRNSIGNTFADDSVYAQNVQYTITIIDSNPDSAIVEAVSKLPKCRYSNHFVSDNLHHDVFELFF